MGVPDRRYEIDAFHEEFSIVLEIEAGRAIMGNAIYRDLIQMSLMVDAKYAVIAMPLRYEYQSSGRTATNLAYEDGKSLLEAIYGSSRIVLPFDGILLVGY